jgi:uncharacterized protein
MFFLVILSVWTVLHAYVFWRAASIPAIQRRVPRKLLIIAGVVAWSSYIAAALIEPVAARWLAWISLALAGNWLGLLFLLFVCMFFADVVTGFGYLLPRYASSIRACALLAGIVLSGVALFQGMRAPVVHDYEVRMAGLPRENDGMVVVVASDFHLGVLLGREWLSERVDQINAQRADLVVLAGDIVEGHGGSPSEFLPAMRRLSAPLGVWAVNGNHEGYGRSDERSRFQQDAGFHVLRDRWAEVRPGLIIAGVDDLTSRRRRLGRDAEFVDHALAGRPAGSATIFVSHTPWQADRTASQRVGLMLSAHTHGGQIWPFNYIVGMVYPLLAGKYEVAGMPVIVCRGTGTWGPRMRLWSRGEILRIVLRLDREDEHASPRSGRVSR